MSDKTQAIIDRAEELCALSEEEEAEKLVRDALEKETTNLDLKTKLATILSRRGYDHKTEPILREVLVADRLHETATSALGNLLGNSLRNEEAEVLFKSFLDDNPHGHMVLDDLSRLLYDGGRVEEALEIGRNHVASYPQELAAYDALKYVLAMQEDDLSTKLAEEPEDIARLERYATNLVEQYSILQRMKDCDVVHDCKDGEREQDIREDVDRVVAEIKDIQNRLSRLKTQLHSDLMAQIVMILDPSKN